MFFKVIVPISAIALMALLCYQVCRKPEGFDLFLFWILMGLPFGIRRMSLLLIPKHFDIAGSLGVIALNCIVGGLIGGAVVIVTAIKALAVTIGVISGRLK